MTPKRDASKVPALWKAIREQAADDDLADVLAMSDAELDKYLADNGGDPAAIRSSGKALAKELQERHAELAWHDDMAKKLEAFRATAAASRSTVKLGRPELLLRLDAARKDPRFTAPVAALFRKKTPEAFSDDELQALLEQIELLAKLEDE